MAIRKLEKSEWRPFLERFSKFLEGKRTEIEVLSLNLGDQVAAAWLPLLGITYDPKDDLIDVALDPVDHLIRQPTELYLDEDVGGLMSIEIVTAEGSREIVKLRDPLMLPAPAH